MSLKTQAELESEIEHYKKLYKKYVKLESKLAKTKAKGKVVRVFKINLDKMRNEINLLEEKLNKEKTQTKHLEEKN